MTKSPDMDALFVKLDEHDEEGARVEWDKMMIKQNGLDVTLDEYRKTLDAKAIDDRERFIRTFLWWPKLNTPEPPKTNVIEFPKSKRQNED